MAGRIISAFRFALNADARTFNREMRKGSRTITDQERAMRQLQRTVRNTGQRFTAFQRNVLSLRGALVGVAAVGGFLRLAQESTKAATSLVELADRTGFATDRLQTLSRVFEGDGVSVEAFTKSIGRMTRTINDAYLGLSTARDALGQIGLTFDDLKDLRPEEQFDLIAKGIGDLATESERAGVVQNIFGRGAQGFINVLQRGTESLNEQEEAFRRLGLTSEDGLRSLKALNQEFTNLSTTLQVSLQQSFAESADELKILLEDLQELIRTSTPIAIQGVSSAARTGISLSENSDAALTAIGSYFGGRALASLGTQLGRIATAFGSGGTLATAVTAFGTRLAALAGPAGILASVIALMFTFREQLTEAARSVDTTGVEFSSQVPNQQADITELTTEIERLKQALENLPNVFDDSRNIQESQIAIRGFARENLNEENFESLSRLFDDAIRGDVRSRRGLEINQDKLEELTSDVINALIEGLEKRVQGLEEGRIEVSTGEDSTFDDTSAREQAAQLAEQDRQHQEALNELLQEQIALRNARIEADLNASKLQRDISGELNQQEIVEGRLNELLREREEIDERIASFRQEGLESQVPELLIDRVGLEREIERVRTVLLTTTNLEIPVTPIVSDVQGLSEIVGEDGLTVINQENLEQASTALNQIINLFPQLPEQADALDEHLKANAVRLQNIGDATQDWLTSMRDGLAQVIVYTDDWGQALERLGRLAITNLISSLFTEDRLRGIFTGRQFGGHVNVGQTYLVGESGPELFIPKTAGDIIPNRELSDAGGVNITFAPVIQSTDGPGVRNALNQVIPVLKRDILQTISNQSTIAAARSRMN